MRAKWFWLGFVAGIFYFSYIFAWLWSAYPLDSLGFSGFWWPFLFISFAFVVTIAVMALFWGIAVWLVAKLNKHSSNWFLPFAASGTFTVAEYLRSWFFGILWSGNGSLFGPHWTFGNPAYLLSPIKLLFQTLSVWGIYGLNILFVFIVVSMVFFLIKRTKIFLAEASAAVALIIAVSFISQHWTNSRPAGQTLLKISVNIIQTKTPAIAEPSPEEILSDFSQKLTLLKESVKREEDNKIIIMPENANFSKMLSGFLDPFSLKKFFNKLSEKEFILIDNDRVAESGKFKSRTMLLSSKDGAIDFYDKRLLTPAGEFLPFLFKWPLSVLNPALKNRLEAASEFAKGAESNILKFLKTPVSAADLPKQTSRPNLRAKMLICSDLASPALARNGNFDFIIAQNSFGIFHGGSQIQKQLLAMTRARAVENARDLVFASNFGRSYIINASGAVTKIADNAGYEILTGEIAPRTVRTWYNKLGDWPVLVLSLLFISFAFFSKFFGHFLKKLNKCRSNLKY